MKQEELNDVIRKHELWLRGKEGGKKAVLYGADLRWAKISGADLCDADLRKADLHGADLCGANLLGADLRWASLRGAKMYKKGVDNASLSQKQRDEIIICNLAND